MEKIYCDSSTTENCVVLPDGSYQLTQYIEKKTNNAGEYLAAIAAVKIARQSDMADFCVFTDSRLVVNQTKNIDRCKAPNLWPLCQELRGLLGSDHIHYKDLKIQWIPREENPAGIILEGRTKWKTPAKFVMPN